MLIVGTGSGALSDAEFRKLAQAVLSVLAEQKLEEAYWLVDDLSVAQRDQAWQLTQLALAVTLREYRYTQTLSKPKSALALRKLRHCRRHQQRRSPARLRAASPSVVV